MLDIPYDGYCFESDGTGFRQRDLTLAAPPKDYLAHYLAIDDKVRALSAKRLRVLEAFTAPYSSRRRLLDFGCGTGRFVEAAIGHGWLASGCDLVRPPGCGFPFLTPTEAAEWKWDVVAAFDSLEHLADPAGVVRELGAEWFMVSVPNCEFPEQESWFMNYRHRRPGTHLWHWNADSLKRLFARCGYRTVLVSCWEDEYRPNDEQVEDNVISAIFRKAR